MTAPSPARRVRGKFISFGLWTSVVAFVVIEGDALWDQLQIGQASILFMFGTACLAAAACLGLFAVISTVGLAVSAAFSEEHPQRQSGHRSAAFVDGTRQRDDLFASRYGGAEGTTAADRTSVVSKSGGAPSGRRLTKRTGSLN
jgi:hypothetical protein